MHRITLNIDLDANDLLEKEVVEAIKAETKRLTRERIDKIINESIDGVIRERTRHWDNPDWRTRNQLEEMVDGAAMRALKKYDFRIDKSKIISEIDDRLKAVDNLAKMKLSYMDKQIEEAIERKVREYLNDYCFDKTVERIKNERNNDDA